MIIAKSFIITQGAMALDGGTIGLSACDEHGQQHQITLTQHAFTTNLSDTLPGRLYYDGQVIATRSNDEAHLLEAIKQAEIVHEDPSRNQQHTQNPIILGQDIRDYFTSIAQGPDAALLHLMHAMVSYIESDAYVQFIRDYELSLIHSTLYLRAVGPHPLKVMMILRKLHPYSFAEVKELISHPQVKIMSGAKLDIIPLAQQLESVGAIVDIVDSLEAPPHSCQY